MVKAVVVVERSVVFEEVGRRCCVEVDLVAVIGRKLLLTVKKMRPKRSLNVASIIAD